MQRCHELEIDLVNSAAKYEAIISMPEKGYGYDLAAISDLDEPYPSLEQEEMQDAYPGLLDDAQEDSFPTTVPLDFYDTFYGKNRHSFLTVPHHRFNFSPTMASPAVSAVRSVDQLEILSSPSGGYTAKDQEALIQELKKENFDLKLRLYMEQKEREKLETEYKEKIVLLEADLSEALDELSGALDREKEFEEHLNSLRQKEKALITKQKRLGETLREQEQEIQFLTVNRSQIKHAENKRDAETMTDGLFVEERSVDSATGEVLYRLVDNTDGAEGGTKPDTKPEGVDLLNTSNNLAKKDSIIREAKRRRTLKMKRDKKGDTMSSVSEEPPTGLKATLLKRLCCCLPSSQ